MRISRSLLLYKYRMLWKPILLGSVLGCLLFSLVVYIDFMSRYDVALTNLAVDREHNKELYPKKSIVYDFETAAVEDQMQQHDRLVVQGMSFILKLTYEAMQEWAPPPSDLTQRRVCVNVFVKNRPIPYIDPLMMSLMKGQPPSRLNSYLRINVLNIERDPKRREFHHLRHTISKLPFVATYDFSQQGNRFDDVLRSFEICLESTLVWCLLLDDKYIVPKAFVDQLQRHVIDASRDAEEEATVVSLFSRVKYSEWDRLRYKRECPLSNAQRRAYHLPLFTPAYRLAASSGEIVSATGGMLYSKRAVQRILGYVSRVDQRKKQERAKSIEYYLNQLFPVHFNIQPSLVNHIGFYSDYQEPTKTRPFSTFETDIRFQFDAGE